MNANLFEVEDALLVFDENVEADAAHQEYFVLFEFFIFDDVGDVVDVDYGPSDRFHAYVKNVREANVVVGHVDPCKRKRLSKTGAGVHAS
jgi:hypothetical protein